MQQYNNETASSLSDRQNQQGEVTAKNWVSFWGRKSEKSRWQDEPLGAGRCCTTRRVVEIIKFVALLLYIMIDSTLLLC